MLCQLSSFKPPGNTLLEFYNKKEFTLYFFLFVYTICKKETAKILRKIKATLQRNKKSRSKHKQAQQQQAEQQQQQSQHKRPPSSCSQQGDDCEKHHLAAAMESNLNRMINQSLRHPLSGQLSKYTNVMKGKMRWINIRKKCIKCFSCRLAISLVHCGRQDGIPELFSV